jgi:peptide/nickel transport system substrate-binding protein
MWIKLVVLGGVVAVIAMQVRAMLKSDRVYESINRIDSTLTGTQIVSSASGPESDEQSKDGDWLVWAIGAEPETLNPVTSKDLYGFWILWRNVFEGLMEYDSDTFALKPALAESYEVTKGGLEITFRLRDNIYFSDGVPITSEDVLFTYNAIKDPNIDAAKWAGYYKNVVKAEMIDKRTIRFTLDSVYYKSLDYLSFIEIGILPRHVYKYKNPQEFNNRRSYPVGSGPYLFESWQVGRQIVLSRNERYWGKKPHLKKLVYKIVINDLAAVQSLRSGQVDMTVPQPDQYADMLKDKNFTDRFQCLSVWNPRVGYGYMGWNEDTPFFKDRLVRLAMTHIVDREMICKYLLKGMGQVPNGPFYIKGPVYDANVRPWPCDIEKARQLLDEAGWKDHDGDGIRDKDGVAFKFRFMIVSGRSLHEQLGKHLKDQAAKVGIEVTVEPYEWSVFLTRLIDRKFEAVTLAWFGDVVEDPYEVFHSSQIGNRGSNYVGFRNAEADRIMEQARTILDADERIKLYRRMAEILHEEQPFTFLYTRPSQRFQHLRFKNVIAHNIGLDWLEWYVPENEQVYK